MATANTYRATTSMRPDLDEQCSIYLEERSYVHAISLFQSLLASSVSSDRQTPAVIPADDILALLATITVHPTTTSRASSSEASLASELAIQYLYDLLQITGTENSHFKDAFCFRKLRYLETSSTDVYASSLRIPNRQQRLRRLQQEGVRGTDHSASQFVLSERSDLATPLARKASLFWRAETFWDVVGWAFNCAVRHAHRWKYWRAWLEFMIDAIERDWQDRLARAPKVEGGESGTSIAASERSSSLGESLACRYLVSQTDREWRRASRAIFADGSSTTMKEFDEVWKGETKHLKSDEEKLKEDRERWGRKLDLDEGNFGAYGEDGEDGDEDEMDSYGASGPPRKRSRPQKTKKGKIKDWSFLDATIGSAEDEDPAGGPAGDIDSHGGAEAFTLRRRLVALIARVMSDDPYAFEGPQDFLNEAASSISKQPPDLFLLWISPQKPAADKAVEVSLDDFLEPLRLKLLIPLLPSRAVSALGKRADYTEQRTIQDTLLPLAPATTARRDALKLSLLLESLLLAKWSADTLEPTEDLRPALECGIAARASKATGRTSNKGTPALDEDEWLGNSAQRMRMMLDNIGAP